MTNDIATQIKVLINQFNVQNYDHVISKANVLLKKNPGYVILYNLLGSAYQNTGDYNRAMDNFIKGIQLDPNNLALMNNLAMSHKNLLQYEASEKLYLKIISLNNKYINAYVNLGNLKRDLNQFEDAISLYEQALSISDPNTIIFYSLALAHQGIGNFDKAIYYSREALKLDSNFTRADHLISQSTKYEKDNKHYSLLKEKLKNLGSQSLERVDIHFSLAKAEEDIGNIENCVENLIQGNKLKKEIINYNVNKEIRLLNDIKEKFNRNNQEQLSTKSNKENNIIFILGMPRSGTSLIEQIITSHSEVFGGGELAILSSIIKENFVNTENLIKENFKEIIKDPLTVNKLQNDYLNFIENFRYNEKYITDKAPLNFRWIGFIFNIFPNAKVIHCTRDPKNNCLSMFKNLFEGGLNFTYDQDDLVTYYKEYLDLMNFWKSKYKNFIYEVNYENLISNNVEEIKKLISFCDLNWEDDCLKFHKNKTPIKTMSTAQARKPIYKSSLNSFEKFKKYLTIIDKKL